MFSRYPPVPFVRRTWATWILWHNITSADILEKCCQGANNSVLRTAGFGVRRLTSSCIVCHYSRWHHSLRRDCREQFLGICVGAWRQRMETRTVVADGRCGTPWCTLARNLFRIVSVLPNAELTLTRISSNLGCLFSEEEGLACKSAIHTLHTETSILTFHSEAINLHKLKWVRSIGSFQNPWKCWHADCRDYSHNPSFKIQVFAHWGWDHLEPVTDNFALCEGTWWQWIREEGTSPCSWDYRKARILMLIMIFSNVNW